MYIMNAPTSIYFTWKVAKNLLEETTTQKINFSKDSKNDDMWKHVNKSQIEERFGGTAPSIQANYWPPKFPSSEYLTESDSAKLLLNTKEAYLKKFNDGKLAKYKVCKALVGKDEL